MWLLRVSLCSLLCSARLRYICLLGLELTPQSLDDISIGGISSRQGISETLLSLLSLLAFSRSLPLQLATCLPLLSQPGLQKLVLGREIPSEKLSLWLSLIGSAALDFRYLSKFKSRLWTPCLSHPSARPNPCWHWADLQLVAVGQALLRQDAAGISKTYWSI